MAETKKVDAAADDAPRPLIARKSGKLRGAAVAPGDKSISHRALILGAMAVGDTEIEGLLEGEDVIDTARAVESLGATVERLGPGRWRVSGVGVGGFAEPDRVIDHGNSGTGVRLMMGAVATHPFATTFTGDASLRSRPMKRVLDPLALFGARAVGRTGGRLPLTLVGAAEPMPARYALPVASAQVKSAVLLAGLNAPGETVVVEGEATRDHTERMLRGFGATVVVEEGGAEGREIRLIGQPDLTAQTLRVPCDPSSSAFPIVAALLTEGSEVQLSGVLLNPTRTGLLDTLREMGGDISIENEREEGGEPIGDVTVRASALRGVEVPPERAASMIDEYPILSVAAAFAEGETRMLGVRELRVKETDRIAAMAEGLEACGVSVATTEDSMTVTGRGAGGAGLGGGRVAARLDHRIAMSFAVFGLAAERPVEIDDARPIATSFPTFERLMADLGAPFGPQAA